MFGRIYCAVIGWVFLPLMVIGLWSAAVMTRWAYQGELEMIELDQPLLFGLVLCFAFLAGTAACGIMIFLGMVPRRKRAGSPVGG